MDPKKRQRLIRLAPAASTQHVECAVKTKKKTQRKEKDEAGTRKTTVNTKETQPRHSFVWILKHNREKKIMLHNSAVHTYIQPTLTKAGFALSQSEGAIQG
ncbi:uncharacterized protein LOC119575195 [Penaeus monodon]|uniref:uncharacterized protein LOC119575195 n=1 Tax=Penaeus monodon TaxID=6687 RepID=UPI0018A7055B|nr:uncharacterized protein LOC119575195 [Penaeus monodon]